VRKKFLTRLASGTSVAAVATAFLTTGVASATALPNSVDAVTVQADDTATTTTTLNVTPSSPADANTTETLTATLTPTSAAGSVQFTDGDTALGDPVDVTNGTASTTTILPPGDHSLTAVFTPGDTTAFNSSTSDPIDYTVNSNQANRHGNRANLGHNHGNRHTNHRNPGSNRNNPGLGNLGGILGNLGGLQGLLGGIQGILGGALNNPGANPGADNPAVSKALPVTRGRN
jgi:hypothetical protein